MKYYLNFLCTNRNKCIIRRDIVTNSNYSRNYIFARILNIRGILFFTVGFTSWKQISTSYFYISDIQFIPQGFAICFYGRLRCLCSLYLFLIRFLSIGTGFNEYNKKTQEINIFRWGFPGKNRRFKLSYSLSEIESLRLENQNYFLDNNNFSLYLLLNNKKKILLLQNNLLTTQEIEYFSSELARFLKLPLKRNFLSSSIIYSLSLFQIQ